MSSSHSVIMVNYSYNYNTNINGKRVRKFTKWDNSIRFKSRKYNESQIYEYIDRQSKKLLFIFNSR